MSPDSEKGIYPDSNSSSCSCKKILSIASRAVILVPCPSSESILTDPPSSSSTCRKLFKTRSVLAAQTIWNNLSGQRKRKIRYNNILSETNVFYIHPVLAPIPVT